MKSLILGFTFVLSLMISQASGAAKSCRTTVTKSKALDSLFETRQTFDESWIRWFEQQTDRSDSSISSFQPEDRKLSRWQFFNKKMRPELRELLMSARPQFFEDKKLPDPIKLSNALILIYKKRQIPVSEWILPGIVLQNKKNPKIFKAFSYLALAEKWPQDFQVSTANISDLHFNQALNEGIMPFYYKTDIHEKFNIHMTYHDLHHLSSFLNGDYLHVFRWYYKQAFNKINTNKMNSDTASDLFGDRGAYGFIEEFWFVEKKEASNLDQLLSHFSVKNGDSVLSATHSKVAEIRYYLQLKSELMHQFSVLEKRAEDLFTRLRLKGVDKYSPTQEWPVEIQVEREALLHEYKPLVQSLKDLIDKIETFYEHQITRVGATVSDQLSFRAPLYSFSNNYNREIAHLRYELDYYLPRRLSIDWRNTNMNLSNLIIPLIEGLQFSTEAKKAELEAKLKNVY